MEQKETFREKMEAQLQEWDDKIEELVGKAEVATAEAKVQYREQLETLRSKREAAGEKLNALKNSSADTWEDMKTGIESAWSDLKQTVDSTVEKFK